MKRLLMLSGVCLSGVMASAQSISPSGIYGASNTSAGGGVSVTWVLGSLTPEAISALPVKLIDFKCMLTDELVVSVTWSTSEETNSDHFEIQHSINGKYWSEIGRVKAVGESDATRTYAFEHSSPVKGDNLYRLKMVDQDGTYAYSRMRNVHYGGEGGLTFHPNPVVDRLSINARDWPSLENLKIINVSGAKVAEFNYAQLRDMAGKEIDFKKYPSGVYIISITRNDGTVQSEKIIKN